MSSEAGINSLKIVFFTNKSSHGAKLLKRMVSKNIPIEAIFIEKPDSRGKVKKLRRALNPLRFARTMRAISKRLIRILASQTAEEWLKDQFYHFYSNRVHTIDDFNGKQCEQLLMEIEPDMIVLGGARIIRANIIRIPKIGILNAHPGLLPKYRGVDVIPWAIYNGDPIGVTVHFVDEGVDTGRIVAEEVINITESDTISALRERTQIVAGELMAENILKISKNRRIEARVQAKEDGKQYYRMPSELLKEAERRLRKVVDERKSDKI